MEEKSLEFFEKYEIEVTGSVKARGAFRIDTEQGPLLLLPYSGSENRAVFEQSLLRQLAEQGFLVDEYVVEQEQERQLNRQHISLEAHGENLLL